MGLDKSATGLVDVYGWVCSLETELSDDRSSRLELGILRSGKMITLCAHSIGKQISLFLWLEPRGPGESECLGELGNCLIEECTEEKKMQQNLFPLFSRLCFYAFFGIIHKDIVALKIPRSKKKISEKDIEQLLRLEIEQGIIEASVYKRAFNILFYAACCSHLIHREAKLKELAAKLKELAAEVLKIIGPAATESVMKSLASKYTQILLEYEDGSVDKFKFSYSSSFARYWTIHCYCPCLAMQRKIQYNMDMVAGLEYALSHQLLQCMLHVRHDVNFQADWIEVELKIDNLQCKSLQLDSHEAIPRKLEKEWYFPAKIMITMEPECKPGIRAVSLGMSSQNPSVSVSKAKTNERGLQVEQSVKIALQPELESKLSLGFTDSRTTSYTRIIKNWLFDPSVPKATQGRLEWTLYDNSYGMPVFSHQPDYKDRHYKAFRDLARGVGSVRPFTQEGGIVFARDLYGVPITWRLDRDLEGQTLVWFVECEIWLAYYPNQSHTGMEVRYQKFRQPVRLPLVPAPVQHRVSQPTNW